MVVPLVLLPVIMLLVMLAATKGWERFADPATKGKLDKALSDPPKKWAIHLFLTGLAASVAGHLADIAGHPSGIPALIVFLSLNAVLVGGVIGGAIIIAVHHIVLVLGGFFLFNVNILSAVGVEILKGSWEAGINIPWTSLFLFGAWCISYLGSAYAGLVVQEQIRSALADRRAEAARQKKMEARRAMLSRQAMVAEEAVSSLLVEADADMKRIEKEMESAARTADTLSREEAIRAQVEALRQFGSAIDNPPVGTGADLEFRTRWVSRLGAQLMRLAEYDRAGMLSHHISLEGRVALDREILALDQEVFVGLPETPQVRAVKVYQQSLLDASGSIDPEGNAIVGYADTLEGAGIDPHLSKISGFSPADLAPGDAPGDVDGEPGEEDEGQDVSVAAGRDSGGRVNMSDVMLASESDFAKATFGQASSNSAAASASDTGDAVDGGAGPTTQAEIKEKMRRLARTMDSADDGSTVGFSDHEANTGSASGASFETTDSASSGGHVSGGMMSDGSGTNGAEPSSSMNEGMVSAGSSEGASGQSAQAAGATSPSHPRQGEVHVDSERRLLEIARLCFACMRDVSSMSDDMARALMRLVRQPSDIIDAIPSMPQADVDAIFTAASSRVEALEIWDRFQSAIGLQDAEAARTALSALLSTSLAPRAHEGVGLLNELLSRAHARNVEEVRRRRASMDAMVSSLPKEEYEDLAVGDRLALRTDEGLLRVIITGEGPRIDSYPASLADPPPPPVYRIDSDAGLVPVSQPVPVEPAVSASSADAPSSPAVPPASSPPMSLASFVEAGGIEEEEESEEDAELGSMADQKVPAPEIPALRDLVGNTSPVRPKSVRREVVIPLAKARKERRDAWSIIREFAGEIQERSASLYRDRQGKLKASTQRAVSSALMALGIDNISEKQIALLAAALRSPEDLHGMVTPDVAERYWEMLARKSQWSMASIVLQEGMEQGYWLLVETIANAIEETIEKIEEAGERPPEMALTLLAKADEWLSERRYAHASSVQGELPLWAPRAEIETIIGESRQALAVSVPALAEAARLLETDMSRLIEARKAIDIVRQAGFADRAEVLVADIDRQMAELCQRVMRIAGRSLGSVARRYLPESLIRPGETPAAAIRRLASSAPPSSAASLHPEGVEGSVLPAGADTAASKQMKHLLAVEAKGGSAASETLSAGSQPASEETRMMPDPEPSSGPMGSDDARIAQDDEEDPVMAAARRAAGIGGSARSDGPDSVSGQGSPDQASAAKPLSSPRSFAKDVARKMSEAMGRSVSKQDEASDDPVDLSIIDQIIAPDSASEADRSRNSVITVDQMSKRMLRFRTIIKDKLRHMETETLEATRRDAVCGLYIYSQEHHLYLEIIVPSNEAEFVRADETGFYLENGFIPFSRLPEVDATHSEYGQRFGLVFASRRLSVRDCAHYWAYQKRHGRFGYDVVPAVHLDDLLFKRWLNSIILRHFRYGDDDVAKLDANHAEIFEKLGRSVLGPDFVIGTKPEDSSSSGSEEQPGTGPVSGSMSTDDGNPSVGNIGSGEAAGSSAPKSASAPAAGGTGKSAVEEVRDVMRAAIENRRGQKRTDGLGTPDDRLAAIGKTTDR